MQYMDIPGAKGRFLGWFAVLIQAAFSYIGTEIVAICAGESRNPKKSIPKAIRNVYIRIILFYFLGTFVIGLLVDPTSPRLNLYHGTAAASPFVIAIQASGIKALPSIINACLLTSAWSAASSDLYTSSRALYGLAVNGQAPRIFSKVNSWGLPYMAVAISVAFGFLSFMAGQTGTAGQVFGYFANMTSVCGLLTCTFSIVASEIEKLTAGLERVGNPLDLPQVLQGHQGSGHRPQELCTPLSASTVPQLVCPDPNFGRPVLPGMEHPQTLRYRQLRDLLSPRVTLPSSLDRSPCHHRIQVERHQVRSDGFR